MADDIDEHTVNRTRVAYAKMLIEVDLSQPLAEVARIKTESGKVLEQ